MSLSPDLLIPIVSDPWSSIRVSRATTPEDLDRVYKLRWAGYRKYFTEQALREFRGEMQAAVRLTVDHAEEVEPELAYLAALFGR
jgi:hypothetical protein